MTRTDRTENKHVRGTARVRHVGDKEREARLRWFGHTNKMESEHTGRMMLEVELPSRRKRPKRRFLDMVKENIQLVSVTQHVEDRVRGKQVIPCVTSKWKNQKKKIIYAA